MSEETTEQPQNVEQQLAQLRAQLEGRNEELARAESQRDEALSSLTAAQNRLEAQRMLSQAGVVDLETAALLLSKRVDFAEDLDAQTLRGRIEQLLLDKPFLRGVIGPAAPAKTASAKPPRPGVPAQLAQAAQQALETGSRRDIANYLRLRRQAARR